MSLKKFRPNDVIINTMKAHPSCEFFIFDGQVYYDYMSFHDYHHPDESKIIELLKQNVKTSVIKYL